MNKYFTEHPASVDETYGEHFAVSMGIAGQLAKASAQAALHAMVPAFCCTSASATIKRLNAVVTGGARGQSDTSAAATAAAG